MYRDLIRLRRNWFDQTRGLCGHHVHVHHVNHASKVVAFHRWAEGGPGDDVVVVANFANRAYDHYEIGVPRPGLWLVRFNSDSHHYSPDFGNFGGHDVVGGGASMDGMPVRIDLSVGPYSVIVFSQ